jgi:hypothetical protein
MVAHYVRVTRRDRAGSNLIPAFGRRDAERLSRRISRDSRYIAEPILQCRADGAEDGAR